MSLWSKVLHVSWAKRFLSIFPNFRTIHLIGSCDAECGVYPNSILPSHFLFLPGWNTDCNQVQGFHFQFTDDDCRMTLGDNVPEEGLGELSPERELGRLAELLVADERRAETSGCTINITVHFESIVSLNKNYDTFQKKKKGETVSWKPIYWRSKVEL